MPRAAATRRPAVADDEHAPGAFGDEDASILGGREIRGTIQAGGGVVRSQPVRAAPTSRAIGPHHFMG
jgi:hypothetical protein